MKTHRRVSAVLLAASMALSMLTPVRAAETKSSVTGELQATVRVDYVQTLAELQKRDVQAELFQGSNSLGKIDLTNPVEDRIGMYAAQVSLRDRLGGELTGSALPGALDLTVTGLPQGSYTLRFTGAGYRTCDAQFSIGSYNQYVEVGTGDGTFPLGDFDGNGKVEARDTEALTKALGSVQRADLDKFDLNGDNQIDIIDLAYVNHNANAPAAQATVLNTACIGLQVDVEQVEKDLVAIGTTATGNLETLFQDNDSAVTFRNASGGDAILIPLTLDGQAEVENLQIVTNPDGVPGAIQEGRIEVEYEGNSQPLSFRFDNTIAEEVFAIGRTLESNVITIPLGRRVAVKKVTITVTKTEGGQYAVLESVRFLQDIAPEELAEPNSQVKNLSAVPGDGQVSLSWNELPNVSGYRVEYWEKDKESARRSLNVDVARAQVTGLNNLTMYCFAVTPIDGGWQGRTCPPVEATPQPAKAPSAPDMVNIVPLDGQLSVSWKKGENATYYEVYYTDKANASSSDYRQAGNRVTGTALTINGLTNGTTYYLYVVAGNERGKSAPSRIYSGTPVATDYSRPAGIPTEGILDSSKIASIRLADAGNYNAPDYSPDAPFTPENMIDGDYKTHWTASSNWSRNEHVICTFTQPVDLYSAIWVPRLDGTYPSNLRAYSVRVWYQGEDLSSAGHLLVPDPERGGLDNGGTTNAELATWPNIPNLASVATTKFAVLPFGPVQNVIKISLAVEQRDYTKVSLSELMFLEYDPALSLPDQIAALFADDLRTQLKRDVTEESIAQLEARLNSEERNYYLNVETLADELALARELLAGGTTSGVVLQGVQSRSNAADRAKYQQSGSELQPLGVAAKAGTEITVYASGIPAGETVTVYASQFNAEASTWLAQVGTLTNGQNILVVPKIGSQNTQRGGSLYFTYSGAVPQSIQLHVRRAVDIPLLELSDWYTMDETQREERILAYVKELDGYVKAQGINAGNAQTSCLNVTEISMPMVLLSIPAAAVLNANGQSESDKVTNLYQNVLAWEDLMHICKTTQGIDKTYAQNDMTSRQNIRCMQMFAGAFMYAAGSHVGIGYSSCGGMVSGLPIAALGSNATANRLFGWGIAHEIGHNMDKLGRAEITNNLYSLMVQTYDGKENTFSSRLELGGKYPAIFTKTAQGWPGESNNVFVQLGMYWQLHLAYDGGTNPMDFYNRFFKAWKSGQYTKDIEGLSYEEKVALTASGVANKDLTEFFTRWGMRLSQPVMERLNAYEAESRALWYLSDQSRRDRLEGVALAAGSVTAQAEIKEENQVVVTVQPTITGKVQGYEILRDDESIAFVTAPNFSGTEAVTYTDTIGSANHRVYSYQVRAYGVQGEAIGTATTQELRIAYDKTVDPSAYELTRNGTTVTFQLKEGSDVSGLKLTGDKRPNSGEFSVTITTTQSDKEIVARMGSFDGENQSADPDMSYLTYFQKPGADQMDTRIWTYNAKTVTVTGIPAAMAEQDIQLISYAGDDVAFLKTGALGVLDKDYVYGTEEGDVIPAGSLVITGTYRGDPRYLLIEIKGRFSKAKDEALEDTTVEERVIAGEVLFFAEVPEDGAMSDISDGVFLFIPDLEQEAQLQEGEPSQCDGIHLLPSQIQAVLYRTDLPSDPTNKHKTAETMWIYTPGGADLPTIVLEGAEG